MYNPKSPYTVYCYDCFISDKWDPYEYGVEYDPSKSFFEQLKGLTLKVPKAGIYISISNGPNFNSEYMNFAGGNKDSYLVFNSGPGNENSAYSRGLIYCKDVYDCYYN